MGTVKFKRLLSSCRYLAKSLELSPDIARFQSSRMDKAVRDIFKFDREDVRIPTTNLVTQKFKPRLVQHNNIHLLRIDFFLKRQEIVLLVEEINSLLLEDASTLKLIPNLNIIFIECKNALKLTNKPIFHKPQQKEQLSSMVQKLVKLYKYLKEEELVNEVILDNMVQILVQNNRVIQAYNILTESPLCRSTLNLLNWEIKIAGDALPETWKFATGRTLDMSLNKPVYKSKTIGVSDCMKLVRDAKLDPNLETVNSILLVIGKSRNVKLLNEVIERTWRVEDAASPLLTRQSLLYPNLDTLISVIQGFAYNGRFMEGLEIMNKFMKRYDFQLNDEFWYKLLKVLFVSLKKDDLKLKIFTNLWTFMESQNKNPSWKLYQVRLLFLKEYFYISQMLETLPKIYKAYGKKDPIFSKVVLKQYLSEIIRIQAQKNLHNQSFKLIETWSPDYEFEQIMYKILDSHYLYYYKKMAQYMDRKKLSTDLDDDDDVDYPILV